MDIHRAAGVERIPAEHHKEAVVHRMVAGRHRVAPGKAVVEDIAKAGMAAVVEALPR